MAFIKHCEFPIKLSKILCAMRWLFLIIMRDLRETTVGHGTPAGDNNRSTMMSPWGLTVAALLRL